MIIEGRTISSGKATGRALKLDEPFSFLGGVDPDTGTLTGAREDSLKESIFVFPRGKGSTVGSYVMFDMKVRGTLPLGIVNDEAEPIVATGAVMSGIPMVDRIDTSVIRDGDSIEVDGEGGIISLKGVNERDTVMSVVISGDELLLVRDGRSPGPFCNMWSGIWDVKKDGEDTISTGRRTIRGTTGVETTIMKRGPEVLLRHEDTIWRIHPLLLEPSGDDVVVVDNLEYKWFSAEGLGKAVPGPSMKKVLNALQLI